MLGSWLQWSTIFHLQQPPPTSAREIRRFQQAILSEVRGGVHKNYCKEWAYGPREVQTEEELESLSWVWITDHARHTVASSFPELFLVWSILWQVPTRLGMSAGYITTFTIIMIRSAFSAIIIRLQLQNGMAIRGKGWAVFGRPPAIIPPHNRFVSQLKIHKSISANSSPPKMAYGEILTALGIEFADPLAQVIIYFGTCFGDLIHHVMWAGKGWLRPFLFSAEGCVR
jgi:hypothetical protein